MLLASVKDIVNQAALEIGTAQSPITIVFGSADQDIVQMVALMANVSDELLLDPPYRDALGDGNWLYDPGLLIRKARATADTGRPIVPTACCPKPSGR